MKYSKGFYGPGLLLIYNHAKESENLEEMAWSRKYLEKIAEISTKPIRDAINYQLSK